MPVGAIGARNFRGSRVALGGNTVTEIVAGGKMYRVHTYTTTGSGTFSLLVPVPIEVLIVAGGGGSTTSPNYSGGGGGGGILAGTFSTPAMGQHSLSVGAGSVGYASGSNSTLTIGGTTYTANGGGAGGSTYNGGGGSGGSGGGGGGGNTPGTNTGGPGGGATQTTQSPLTGYGYAGGHAGGNEYGSAQGGGGGGVGSFSGGSANGYVSSISGSSVEYSRGGYGAWNTGVTMITAPGTGGATGGSGQAGIIIIRYALN